MKCKCCGQELDSAVGFNYGRRNGRMVAISDYTIVTCRTPGCALQHVTASTTGYDQTVDAFLAAPPVEVDHA